MLRVQLRFAGRAPGAVRAHVACMRNGRAPPHGRGPRPASGPAELTSTCPVAWPGLRLARPAKAGHWEPEVPTSMLLGQVRGQ